MKKRHLILYEEGTVLLMSRGHIKTEFRLDGKSQVTLSKNGKSFTLKTSSKHVEVFETPDAEVWVSILKSIQGLVVEHEMMM